MQTTETSKFILPNPELEVEIYYLRHNEGGRSTPVYSGYRGQFHYEYKDWDAGQQFIDKSQCNPGEIIVALLQTATPSQHAGKFYEGKKFEIREGNHIVGLGNVKKVLDPAFQKTEIGKYERFLISRILANQDFIIHSVNNLDSIRYRYFDAEEYPLIKSFVQGKQLYRISDGEKERKGFREYLDILTFLDQDGKEYAVTFYDNDEAWQDPQIIDLFKYS